MDRQYKIVIILFLMVFLNLDITNAYEFYNINNVNCTSVVSNQQLNSKRVFVPMIKVNSSQSSSDSKLNTKLQPTNSSQANVVKISCIKKDKPEETEKYEDKEVISLNDDQLYLLSKLVAAEARGESYEGQVAVAAVVINRVKDPRFPDSIEGVIYQKNAFSVVKDGYIDIQPTNESYKAAKEAIQGNDPTSKAIYFWNPDISTCRWINTLNPYLRIGKHVFAK